MFETAAVLQQPVEIRNIHSCIDRKTQLDLSPRSGGIQSAIRQESDRPAPLQVANDRSVGLTALEGKVINTDDIEIAMLINRAAANHP